MATETLALFEHLEFDFLEEFDVFAPARRGRTQIITHQHSSERSCTATTRTSTASVQSRELQNTVVWLSCGFDRPPSRDAVDRFLTDLEHVVDGSSTASSSRPPAAACSTDLSIDSTDVRTMPADQDASKATIQPPKSTTTATAVRSSRPGKRSRLPRSSPEQASARGTAMRVTCDALAVEKPIWMLGDSAYDTLGWHDHLLAAGVVPVIPYNARNTDDPKDIEYRVEARIDEHSEDVQLKQSTLDETYNRRVESNEPTTPSGLRPRARSRPRAASTHEHKCSSRCAFVSLLRSPTTNAETIQEAPSSRYENYSMTPSVPCNNQKGSDPGCLLGFSGFVGTSDIEDSNRVTPWTLITRSKRATSMISPPMRASWIAGQGALVGSPKTKAPFVSGVGVPEHPLSLIPRPKTVHEQPDEPINDALDTLEDDINQSTIVRSP